MNATKAILFCAMAAIVAGCASFAPVDPDAVAAAIPGDTIHYHEGGAPWNSVEELTLVLPEHRVRIECYRDYDARRMTNAMSRLDAVVSDDEWRWVAGQLAKSNVKNWSGSYPGAGYAGGTSWSMEFLRAGNVVQSASGSNNRSRHYREFRAIKRWAERKASWTEDGFLSMFPDERRKAERGDSAAQVFIGDLLLYSEWRDSARKWFLAAAWHGDTNALERLRSSFPETNGTAKAAADIELIRECLAKAGFEMPGIPEDEARPAPKTLDDFADALNAETWDGFREAVEGARVESVAEVHLPGMSDPMIFLRTVSGSICGSTIYVLRRDPETGKWRNQHEFDEEDGSDLVLIPVESDGRTRFLEVDVDFETKLQTGFAVLDYVPEKDEWTVAASARVRHFFRPSYSDRTWISGDRLSEIVTNGIPAEHWRGGPFEVPSGSRTIRALPFQTSVGYSPDGYHVSILDENVQVWPDDSDNPFAHVRPGRFVRGFLPVEDEVVLSRQPFQLGKRHCLVLLDYGHCKTGFGIELTVLDTDTLETVYESVVPDIPYLELK